MGKNAMKILKFEGCWKMKRQDPCVGKVGLRRIKREGSQKRNGVSGSWYQQS